MTDQTNFSKFLNAQPYAAIVLRQKLQPIEGEDAVFFPPTFASPQDNWDDKQNGPWTGYNIDRFEGGRNSCLIDSVGSQANRIEPMFGGDFKELIPQIVIEHEKTKELPAINIVEVGHRAADALVRYSSAGPDLQKIFAGIRLNGNVEALAKQAPTSIIFGLWDSRGTQIKLPRIVQSVIRANNVDVLHRSATYATLAGKVMYDGLEDTPKKDDPRSALGLTHVPASWSHGGVRLRKDGNILREASLNLVALRSLVGDAKMHAYLLGLSLVALLAKQTYFLRAGCQFVRVEPPVIEAVTFDNTREGLTLTLEDAIASTKTACKEFLGTSEPETKTYTFKKALATNALADPKKKKGTPQ